MFLIYQYIYISIYKKRSNFLVAPPNSVNGNSGVGSTSDSETANNDLTICTSRTKKEQNRKQN